MTVFGMSGATKPGIMQMYAGNAAPDGWLICDGAAVSRTLYAELFAAIGTAYGAGDGTTTFNIPNLVNQFPEGNGQGYEDAGLPNITGSLYILNYYGVSGAFAYNAGELAPINGQSALINMQNASFDASRSSSIYGNSTTVQPAACRVNFIIKY